MTIKCSPFQPHFRYVAYTSIEGRESRIAPVPGTFYALRASNGTPIWHYSGASVFTPRVANGVVYIGPDGGTIAALNASNGHQIWKQAFDVDQVQSAQLVNDTIYISTSAGSSDGTIYALHAQDGSLFWDYPILGPVFNPPILDGTTVYIGATDGMVYALRADNGRIVWHYLVQVGG